MTQEETLKALKEAMGKGVVAFEFEKADGSIRKAYGTTSFDVIPAKAAPSKNTGTGARDGFTNYYDTDKKDWRCFRNDRLIGIINE